MRVTQDQIVRDITRHVIPGWKGTPRDTTPTTSYPTESQTAQDPEYNEIGRGVQYDKPLADEARLDYRFRTALSFGAGYGWARGDWFEPFDEGPSYHVQARIALGGTVYLNLGYRYWDLGKVDAKVLFGDNTLTGRQQVDLTSQEFVTNIRIAFYSAPLEEMAPRKWDWPHWEGPRWWQRSKRRMSRWQWRRPRWLGGAGF